MINHIPVRFFYYDEDANAGEGDFAECGEADFLEAKGEIEYERNTVFENGISQICLTKNPFAGC